MDGIIAMEGNGPMNGDPVKMGLLMFSADPIALDATVCRIIGVNPEYSLTVKFGREAGLGTYSETEIELVGDPISSFQNLKFKVDREPLKSLKTGRGILKLMNNVIVPKPYIIKTKCKKCGICVKMCPVNPKAINWHDNNKDNPPSYKYNQCIRCYCCQELCPEGAIKIKKPLVRKLLGKKK
jgi:ferredoxin